MVSNDEISRKLEEKREGITLPENTKIEPKMNFCPSCGIKNNDGSKFCPNCGTELINSDKNSTDDDDNLSNIWILIGALFPIIGVIAGLYYAFKGKKGAWALIVISLIFWAVWAIIFNLI